MQHLETQCCRDFAISGRKNTRCDLIARFPGEAQSQYVLASICQRDKEETGFIGNVIVQFSLVRK
jgi:hypothetical protein